MNILKTWPGIAGLTLALGMMIPLPTVSAQEPEGRDELYEQRPPERRRRPLQRDPQQLRERLEELRAEDPEDPRIDRLEKMLERMESGEFDPRRRGRDRRGGGGAGRGEGHPDSARFSPEQVEAFIDKHPELREIFKTPSQRGQGRRGVGRNQRQIMEIMRAYEDGETNYGDLLIESAQVQHQIGEQMRAIRKARRGGQPDAGVGASSELRPLIRKQVMLEHQIEGLKIEKLQARLEGQREQHAKQAERLESVIENRLERVISGKRGERRQRGEGRSKRRDQFPDE